MVTNKTIANATKWSAISEIIAKLISPITNIILARLLTPEMFGVVVTITLVISFAEIFSDAGFQRYIIQHNFESKNKLYEASNIAFSCHLIISLILWFVIILFNDKIANLVGSPGTGKAIIVSCVSLPITAVSSIQTAIFKRDLQFKHLFKIRIAGVITPLLVTVPLAFFLRNYWALLIGTIASNIVIAISLSLNSPWQPQFHIRIRELKEMFSFSIWSLVESILTWLTSYVDIMILSTVLSSYYIGIYKTSMVTSNQILSIITATTNSVLFSSLSRFQDKDEEFKKIFYTFQRTTSYIVIPLGIFIFLYRDVVTNILLGSQWTDAIDFIGLWGLVGGLYIITGGYASEIYRAIGKPNISALAQLFYIVVIVIALKLTINSSFEMMYIVRTFSRVAFIIIHFILLKCFTCISIKKMMYNLLPIIVSSFIMFCVGEWVYSLEGNSTLIFIFSAISSFLVYLLCLLILPITRRDILTKLNTYLFSRHRSE